MAGSYRGGRGGAGPERGPRALAAPEPWSRLLSLTEPWEPPFTPSPPGRCLVHPPPEPQVRASRARPARGGGRGGCVREPCPLPCPLSRPGLSGHRVLCRPSPGLLGAVLVVGDGLPASCSPGDTPRPARGPVPRPAPGPAAEPAPGVPGPHPHCPLHPGAWSAALVPKTPLATGPAGPTGGGSRPGLGVGVGGELGEARTPHGYSGRELAPMWLRGVGCRGPRAEALHQTTLAGPGPQALAASPGHPGGQLGGWAGAGLPGDPGCVAGAVCAGVCERVCYMGVSECAHTFPRPPSSRP